MFTLYKPIRNIAHLLNGLHDTLLHSGKPHVVLALFQYILQIFIFLWNFINVLSYILSMVYLILIYFLKKLLIVIWKLVVVMMTNSRVVRLVMQTLRIRLRVSHSTAQEIILLIQIRIVVVESWSNSFALRAVSKSWENKVVTHFFIFICFFGWRL